MDAGRAGLGGVLAPARRRLGVRGPRGRGVGGQPERRAAPAGELGGPGAPRGSRHAGRAVRRSGPDLPLLSRCGREREEPGHWNLSISLRNQGRLREALTEARRYRNGEDFGETTLPGAMLEAQVRFEMGDFAAARALFDSIAGAPTTPPSPARAARNRVWYLTHMASAMAAAGDTTTLERLADSVERVGRASAYGRDHLLHYHIRGLLAEARGRTADAAALFARASYSLTGGFSRNNLEWGRALVAVNRPAEAIPVLRGALSGPPDASGLYATFADFHEMLGKAFDLAGQSDSAVVHYRWVDNSWKDADPAFATRRAGVRARLQALGRR